jgi:hypothetical protein
VQYLRTEYVLHSFELPNDHVASGLLFLLYVALQCTRKYLSLPNADFLDLPATALDGLCDQPSHWQQDSETSQGIRLSKPDRGSPLSVTSMLVVVNAGHWTSAIKHKSGK